MAILVCPFGDWQEIFMDPGRDRTHLPYPLPWEEAVFQPSSSRPRRVSSEFQIICRTMWPCITLPPACLNVHPREPGKIMGCSGKGKNVSPSPSPKETRNFTCFPKTLLPEVFKGPGEISHQKTQTMTVSNMIGIATAEMTALLFRSVLIALADICPCFQ